MSISARTVFPMLLVVTLPGLATAQIPNCGTVTLKHDMRQTPNYKQSVDVTASTTRAPTLCPLEVQTEAWVDGLTSYVTVKRDLYSATASQTRSVPSYGTWNSTAKHYLIWASGTWNDLGPTYGRATVVPPPTSANVCLLTQPDCPDGFLFVPSRCDCKSASPILIDTLGDGYHLTSAADGVSFDLNDNGLASERIAWTEPGSDDGWLVMDRNGNGSIDSGAELFGNRTPAFADRPDPRAENGFEALLLAEGPGYGGGVPDGIIDARDAVYRRLRLWFDRNHNGRSEPEELMTLPNAGVVAISTEYRPAPLRDQYGNRFALAGRAWVRDHRGHVVERRIFDVFLTVYQPETSTATAEMQPGARAH